MIVYIIKVSPQFVLRRGLLYPCGCTLAKFYEPLRGCSRRRMTMFGCSYSPGGGGGEEVVAYGTFAACDYDDGLCSLTISQKAICVHFFMNEANVAAANGNTDGFWHDFHLVCKQH